MFVTHKTSLSLSHTHTHCSFQYRSDLESHVVDAATTSEAVGFITLMQSLKRKMHSWEQQVEVFRAGEKILDRQRFQFPSGWVCSVSVEQ